MRPGSASSTNDAHYVTYDTFGAQLFNNSAKQKWIATIPHDCIIEAVKPCEVSTPNSDSVSAALKIVEHHLRDYKNYWELERLSNIKRELNSFSIRTREWTDAK